MIRVDSIDDVVREVAQSGDPKSLVDSGSRFRIETKSLDDSIKIRDKPLTEPFGFPVVKIG
jgi:hypothetical protein